jgi:hypothetical protein
MIERMASVLRMGLLGCMLAVAGCSSVNGSAIRTGPVQLGAYSGPVAIYASGQTPPGAIDLGVIEVHAFQQEGTVETLLPQFVSRVAQIGGNVAVIDGVRARFELAGRTQVETFYYACGIGATCGGTRVYSTNDELMIVSMYGRALTTQLPGGGAPLIPTTPPPAPPPPPSSDEPPPTPPTPPEPAPETSPGPTGEQP